MYWFLMDPKGSIASNLPPEAFWTPIAVDGPFGAASVPKEYSATLWRTHAITTANKYPVETMKFFDYVIAGEGSITNSYGIEGLTYEMRDGVPVTLADYKLADNEYLGANRIGGILDDTWIHRTINPAWLDENPTRKEAIQSSVKEVLAKVKAPFSLPIPAPEDGKRITNIMAEVETYREEMMTKYILGQISIDENFDQYVVNMKGLGIDEVLAIYQKLYDARR
jgi:hypothetical protein